MDDKKDDEIEIDFGKLKGFLGFGRKKPEGSGNKDTGDDKGPDSKAKEHSQNKDDEELSIDFKKIGGFFKGSGKDKEKAVMTKSGDKEDEIRLSFDFKKVKGFFKGAGGKGGERGTDGDKDEVPVDVDKIIGFVKKHHMVLLLLLLLFIPTYCSVYYRMLPRDILQTDAWAENTIYSTVKNDINNVVQARYPNLPAEPRSSLVEEQFQAALDSGRYTFQAGQFRGQTIDLKLQIRETSKAFKEFFKDEKGNNYMPDIDPYYWFRYARNIVEHGFPGDEKRAGENLDNHQLAPNGRLVAGSDLFQPYFLAYFYKFVKIFDRDATLLSTTMIYPVVVSIISIIIVFLIARRIAGDVAGFFASLAVGVNQTLLVRTLYGHADSDPWVLLFSVLVTWLFLEAFELKRLWAKLGTAALAGIATGLFSAAWGGWWYLFDFMLLSSLIYLGYLIIVNRDEARKNIKGFIAEPDFKNSVLAILTFVIFSGIFVSVFIDFNTFLTAPLSTVNVREFKTPVLETLWPNVLTTVAELNEGSIERGSGNDIIASVGGEFLFYLALMGIVLSMVRRNAPGIQDLLFIAFSAAWFVLALWLRSQGVVQFILMLAVPVAARFLMAFKNKIKDIDVKAASLLIMLFIGTVYASTKGIRFTLLLVPAYSIAVGVAIGVLHRLASEWAAREFKLQKAIPAILIFLIFLAPFRFPVDLFDIADSSARQDLPIINDAWYNALIEIRDNSNESAIITSWWDFGHHFKSIADRPVTFDGTTQDKPQAHWVGKILLTNNEKQAIGILRMLDCGGNNAYEELFNVSGDEVKSVNIIYDIIEENKQDARAKLTNKYDINEERATAILNYTHCQPPEAFFIASDDMIGKSGVWGHFGSWNFERAAIWRDVKRKGLSREEGINYMTSKFNYSREDASSIYTEIQAIQNEAESNSWVTGWPGYQGQAGCSVENEVARCENGLMVNLTTMNATFPTPQGSLHPQSFVYVDDKRVVKVDYDSGVIPEDAAALLVPDGGGGYSSVIMNSVNVDSMFTRMFFLNGHGLKYFKPFSFQRGLIGTTVYVFRVDWEGKGESYVNQWLKPAGEAAAAETGGANAT